MEGSIGSTDAKSIEGDKSDLSIVDGVNGSKESTIISALKESTASVDPNILVITLSIDKARDLLGSLSLSEVLLIIEVNVVGCHFPFCLIINNYYM